MQLTPPPARLSRGFSLVELAVVLAIVALLIGGAMATLSSQVEQRNFEETRRRLDAAVEALLGFAVANRRLPCPAVGGATGDESQTPAASGNCTSDFGGFLPARSIGLQPLDADGYAIDAWNNRIRYAVSRGVTGCTGTSTLPHFTSQANLKANGVSCLPNDIDICAPANAGTVCTAANRVVSTQTVAFVVFSTGKNGAILASHGAHESANLDGNSSFISRTPSGSDAIAGAYDDIMLWTPVGVLYNRLIAAGVLP